jgi:hypothetical protein
MFAKTLFPQRSKKIKGQEKCCGKSTHVGHGAPKNNVRKCIGDPGEKQDMNKESVIRFERPALVTRTKSGQKPQDMIG